MAIVKKRKTKDINESTKQFMDSMGEAINMTNDAVKDLIYYGTSSAEADQGAKEAFERTPLKSPN